MWGGETPEGSNSPEHSSTSPLRNQSWIPRPTTQQPSSAVIGPFLETGKTLKLGGRFWSLSGFHTRAFHPAGSERTSELSRLTFFSLPCFCFVFFFLRLFFFFFFVSPKNFLLLWKMFGRCLLSSALPLSRVSSCLLEEVGRSSSFFPGSSLRGSRSLCRRHRAAQTVVTPPLFTHLS